MSTTITHTGPVNPLERDGYMFTDDGVDVYLDRHDPHYPILLTWEDGGYEWFTPAEIMRGDIPRLSPEGMIACQAIIQLL